MTAKDCCDKFVRLLDRRTTYFPIILFSITLFLLTAYTMYHWFPTAANNLYFYLFKNADDASISKRGQIGDAFGGTLSPLVGLIAALLTGLAFWVQLRANIQQREDIQLERLESKFFDMLKLHRDNVLELNILNKYTGRKVFISLYREFRFTYFKLKKLISELSPDKLEYYQIPTEGIKRELFLCNFSYMIFYIGVGKTSNKLLKDVLTPKVHPELLSDVISDFTKLHREYFIKKNRSKSESTDIDDKYFTFEYAGERFRLYTRYKPFDGHLIRLGHYYRHLIQTVKMIDEAPENIVKDKYFYLRNLRAQLSGHEQVMLYYNALSDYGTEWFEKPFFTDYAMVRNVPLPLADFGVTPEQHPVIKNYLANDPSILEGVELRQRHSKEL